MILMPGAHVYPYQGVQPKIGKNVLLTSGSVIVGDVSLGDDSSVWFNSVLRGDVQSITVGARTNVQDNSVIHVTHKTGPTVIGDDVTIGHSATIHACTIGNFCLIGMGATLLDKVEIADESMVAAGSLVPPGKKYPPRVLIRGNPAVVARPLTEDEIKYLHFSSGHYVNIAKNYFGLTK
jgi:carbonic anhydrase/acetyltransferase-like protein (isoleucine patch superfamily)